MVIKNYLTAAILTLSLSSVGHSSIIKRNVVTLSEEDSKLSSTDTSGIEFKESYFQNVSKNIVDLNIKFNGKRFTKGMKSQIRSHLMLNDATYLTTTKEEKVTLYGLEKKKVVKIATTDIPKQDPAMWVTKNIGFDAVVEKFKPGKVKAFIMSPGRFKKGANAILVEGSDNKISLQVVDENYNLKEDKQGFGLLVLRSIKGNSGLFKVVYLKEGVKEVPTGTKIRIETE